MISLVSIVVLLAVFLVFHINRLLNLINYDEGTSAPETVSADGNVQDEGDETDSLSEDSDQTEIDDLEAQILENIQSQSTDIVYDDDVFNILLIGSDGRTTGTASRSDSMILISINKKTEKIVMTSLMRDIYLSISGYENNRLNAAFAFGGASLLLETIRKNFEIPVDKYVWVDFFDFIDIIDMMGGITLDVSDAEAKSMNGYIHEINELIGEDPQDGKLSEGGENLLLDGKQALAYARIRYVGNSDFKRTERQRIVLGKLVDKLYDQSVIELYEILDDLLPNVTTNLTKGELISLLLSVPTYKDYEMIEYRIPLEGTYRSMTIRGMSVLGIDFDANKQALYDTIYQ